MGHLDVQAGRVADGLRAGTRGVDTYGDSDANGSFGGMEASGIGIGCELGPSRARRAAGGGEGRA